MSTLMKIATSGAHLNISLEEAFEKIDQLEETESSADTELTQEVTRMDQLTEIQNTMQEMQATGMANMGAAVLSAIAVQAVDPARPRPEIDETIKVSSPEGQAAIQAAAMEGIGDAISEGIRKIKESYTNSMITNSKTIGQRRELLNYFDAKIDDFERDIKKSDKSNVDVDFTPVSGYFAVNGRAPSNLFSAIEKAFTSVRDDTAIEQRTFESLADFALRVEANLDLSSDAACMRTFFNKTEEVKKLMYVSRWKPGVKRTYMGDYWIQAKEIKTDWPKHKGEEMMQRYFEARGWSFEVAEEGEGKGPAASVKLTQAEALKYIDLTKRMIADMRKNLNSQLSIYRLADRCYESQVRMYMIQNDRDDRLNMDKLEKTRRAFKSCGQFYHVAVYGASTAGNDVIFGDLGAHFWHILKFMISATRRIANAF